MKTCGTVCVSDSLGHSVICVTQHVTCLGDSVYCDIAQMSLPHMCLCASQMAQSGVCVYHHTSDIFLGVRCTAPADLLVCVILEVSLCVCACL